MSGNWLGDTLLRKFITICLIIVLMLVSCWTFSNISSSDNEVVNIVYPERIVEEIVPLVVDEVIPLEVDDNISNDVQFPILHQLVSRRMTRLERLKELMS